MAEAIDSVVTHHTDAFRSGVARFNELLAGHLGVPLVGLFDEGLAGVAWPLLSFKVSELERGESEQLAEILAGKNWSAELFLHEYLGLELERQLVEDAAAVHCGNHEIYEQVRPLNPSVDLLWTPGLLMDDRALETGEISVFSFGMAHKIRSDMFRRLRELLNASGKTWVVFVSAANHETSSIRDAQVVLEEMHAVLPDQLFFLGNLSDVAVFNYLERTTFFAAFFSDGVRSNNTSVASAMERGAVVITNFDDHSPEEFVHMENLIDIERCRELPTDPAVLDSLSRKARETAERRSWDELIARLQTRS